MASVTVDSGEFPLIRNIDHTRQPECMKIYSEWLRIFADNVPEAMAHLDDVIEDAIEFHLWDKVCRGGPVVMFERMGLFDWDLDAAKRALKRLREPGFSREARRSLTRELLDQGMPPREISSQLGVGLATVYRDKDSQKQSGHTKTEKPPRKDDRARFGINTKPETAAGKLVDKFGHEWCRDLVTALKGQLND